MIISEQQRGQAAKGEFSRPTGWLYASVLFVAAYLTVERLTFIHQLDGLGITLWGPSAGLALLSIIRWGPGFGPAVFLASLIADFTVYTGPRGLITPVVTSLVLAGGLTAIAVPLRSQWRAEPIKLKEIYALLFIVPSGVLLMAVAYCLVLLASAQLNPGRFLIAVRNFWIGDTLGILTLVPPCLGASAFSQKGAAGDTLSSIQFFGVPRHLSRGADDDIQCRSRARISILLSAVPAGHIYRPA